MELYKKNIVDRIFNLGELGKDFREVILIKDKRKSLVVQREGKLSKLWFWTMETQERMLWGKSATESKVKGKSAMDSNGRWACISAGQTTENLDCHSGMLPLRACTITMDFEVKHLSNDPCCFLNTVIRSYLNDFTSGYVDRHWHVWDLRNLEISYSFLKIYLSFV